MSSPAFLDKALEAVEAARLLASQSCLNSAANRSYYAVFHAARAALVSAGLAGPHQKWSHEAIQGQFHQLTRRRKIYPARMNGDLSHLRSVRELADYDVEMVSSKDVRDVVKTATAFVMAVEKGTQP